MSGLDSDVEVRSWGFDLQCARAERQGCDLGYLGSGPHGAGRWDAASMGLKSGDWWFEESADAQFQSWGRCVSPEVVDGEGLGLGPLPASGQGRLGDVGFSTDSEEVEVNAVA